MLQETRHTHLTCKKWDSVLRKNKLKALWGLPVSSEGRDKSGKLLAASGGVAVITPLDSLAFQPSSLGKFEDFLFQSGRYVRIVLPVEKGVLHFISLYCMAGRTPKAKNFNKIKSFFIKMLQSENMF
jgi:hypothetical protein